jgi:ABC-2 type transport system permease protein
MRLFWELTKLSFQRQLAYRGAIWAGLVTNAFFGLLRAALLIALYGDRTEVAGLSLRDAVTFTALSQAVIAYLMIFGWYDVMRSVYSGEVASDLLKPMSYFRFWLARDLGRAVVQVFLRGATMLLLYAIFVPITTPTSVPQWLAVVAAICLSWLVSFSWRFFVNLAAFWTPNAAGIGRFAFGLVWVMSGFLMPLRFYPDWFIAICYATPFPALVNTVVEIYLGLLDGPQMLSALAVQAIWAIALIAACHVTLAAGVRRLVIQGG